MNEMGMEVEEEPESVELVNYHGEELPPPDMLGDPDYEGEMARLELLKASRYACDLTDMLKDTDQLPAWIQSKITKASDYLSTVKHYLSDRIELANRDGGGQEGAIEIELDEMLKHEGDKWNVYDSKGKNKLGSHSSKKKALAQIGAIEASKARAAKATRNEQIDPGSSVGSSGQTDFSKIQRGSTSAGANRAAQLAQAKSATGQAEKEFSGPERTLILDLESKFRELATIPGVDLIRVRSKIEQMLKILYKQFEPQIEKSQQNTSG
jgi:hypothetical protein